MKLLGDGNKKKQYEANLRHSAGGGGTLQKAGKKDTEKGFKPIDPAPVTPPEESRTQFWPMFVKHWHVTVTYCCVFWSFGMCVAFLGPTLADLGCRTETPFGTMSWIFFAQALFTLLGSVLGGVLVQRTSAHGCMLVSLLMLSLTLSLVPQCWSLSALALDLAAMGLFMGIIDTVSNLCMIQLYGAHVAPFLQALHFFYALGAFTSPMINEPFLLNNPQRCFDLIDTISEAGADGGNVTDSQLAWNKIREHSHIQYGFWIMSALQVPVVCMVLSVLLCRRRPSAADGGDTTYEITEGGALTVHHGAGAAPGQHRPASGRQTMLITVFTIVLCFMYDGLQGAFGGYIYSYATAVIEGLTAADAAYLTSCFWGMFAIGRLISVAVATKFAPAFMILFNIVGCGLAAVLMLMWQHSIIAVYAGTCMFGFALSSVYPTAISLAESYIHITSMITSTLVVGAAAGEMVQPVIVGHEFESAGPVMFLVNILLVTMIAIVVVFALFIVGASVRGHAGFLRVFACCGNGHFSGEDTNLVSQTQTVKYYSRMPHEISSDELQFTATSKPSS